MQSRPYLQGLPTLQKKCDYGGYRMSCWISLCVLIKLLVWFANKHSFSNDDIFLSISRLFVHRTATLEDRFWAITARLQGSLLQFAYTCNLYVTTIFSFYTFGILLIHKNRYHFLVHKVAMKNPHIPPAFDCLEPNSWNSSVWSPALSLHCFVSYIYENVLKRAPREPGWHSWHPLFDLKLTF